MAVTEHGYFRSLFAAALTEDATTTDLVETGIAFTEGTDIAPTTAYKGCWTLVPDSREPSAESEDARDRDGEIEATVRVSKVATTDENIYDVADAMIDAVTRAVEGYDDGPWRWVHPETGVVCEVDPSVGFDIGLITRAMIPEKRLANVVLYITLHYTRIRP